jgi:signal transduction histidine kinase
VRGQKTLAAELPCLRKDGTVFYADVTAGPITLDGGQECLVGFFADVTERKQAEDKLKRYADDLERANEEVKQFAYIVSHDLRGPLINLRGFTFELRSACATLDSLLTAVLPHLDEEQQREATGALRQEIPQALEFIEASVARMDGFINAVLKLSRLGRNDLHFERVNLHDVVQSALDGLAHQIVERRVRVTVGRLPEVVGDRTAMEQIVGNILTNAVNYLEPGRAGEIEIAGEQRGNETAFFVRDNGRGIAESDMPKVFALFRRAGRQDVKGEGMGLVYAQALAHRHGGYIRCDSELGVGTTFTVVLSNHLEERGDSNAPTTAG